MSDGVLLNSTESGPDVQGDCSGRGGGVGCLSPLLLGAAAIMLRTTGKIF